MPEVVDKVKEKDLASVWPDATGYLIAVRLPRVDARMYPYLLMQYNAQLYRLIGKLFPGCAVTSGYGTGESFLRLLVSRELARQVLGSTKSDLEMGAELAAYCHEHDKDFREIEAYIGKYLEENADVIARWRGLAS